MKQQRKLRTILPPKRALKSLEDGEEMEVCTFDNGVFDKIVTVSERAYRAMVDVPEEQPKNTLPGLSLLLCEEKLLPENPVTSSSVELAPLQPPLSPFSKAVIYAHKRGLSVDKNDVDVRERNSPDTIHRHADVVEQYYTRRDRSVARRLFK